MKKKFIETILPTWKNQFHRNIYKIKKLKINKKYLEFKKRNEVN